MTHRTPDCARIPSRFRAGSRAASPLLAVVLALGALPFSSAQAADASGAAPATRTVAASVVAEIEALEAKINKAYAANALDEYFSYYADDFRGLFPDGITSLAAYKKDWYAFIGTGGGILAFTWSDMQVQVSPSGDAAVASYLAVAKTRYVDKGVVEEKYSETDVFFRRDGKWKLVEVHYSARP